MGKRELITKFFRLLPLKDIIILESSPDCSDSAQEFFEYLLKKGANKKYKIVWFLNKPETNYPAYENVEYFYRHGLDSKSVMKKMLYENRARFILDSNAFVYKQRKDQIRIHMTHGDPYKVAYEYTSLIGDVDGVLTSSSLFKDFYNDVSKIDRDKVLPLGLPRNTVLANSKTFDKKAIIWMPTYRKHNNGFGMEEEFGGFWNGMPAIHSEEEFLKLNALLEEKGLTMYFRPHPAQDITHFKMNKYENFIIADNDYLKSRNVKLYDFVANCGALITDYSSIYNDFLLTGRPIGLTIEDLEEYTKRCGIVFNDFEHDVKGDYILGFDDLLKFINNYSEGKDNSKEEREWANRRYHDLTDCNYSEVLYNYLVDNYNF